MKFILASASDRRKELLSRIISDFEVKISDFDEGTVEVSKDIEKYVKTLAEGKAKSVALNCTNDSIIIGADTIVVIDDNILGKPKDKDDAFRMLKLLSNNVHRVYSGVTVINNEKQVMKSECLYTEVYFSELSDEEIWRYIEIDFEGYSARKNGENIDLKPKEIKLIELLLKYEGKVLTRAQILDNLWRIEEAPNDRVIDVYIKNIRKKLLLDCIVTVKGIGYKFEEQ